MIAERAEEAEEAARLLVRRDALYGARLQRQFRLVGTKAAVGAAVGAAVATESKNPVPEVSRRQLSQTAETREIFAIILLVILVGLIGYVVAGQYASQSAFRETVGKDGVLRLIEVNASPIPGILQAIFLGLLEVGLVGAIFELLNRRANRRVMDEIVTELGEGLGTSVSSQLVQAVLADEAYIKNGLTTEGRQTLLAAIISANVDATATDLARRTASQFAGERRIAGFRVRYEARDVTDHLNPVPCSHVTQSFVSNLPPEPVFRYAFHVVNFDDPSPLDEPLVYTWVHRLNAEQKADDILDVFNVVGAKVNGRRLGSLEKERRSSSVYFSLQWTPDEAETYAIDQVVQLPAPVDGSYVYFMPRELTRGIDISCDLSRSNFAVTTIDTLRTSNAETYRDPSRDPSVFGVRSNDWVEPSASVAFVFVGHTKTVAIPEN